MSGIKTKNPVLPFSCILPSYFTLSLTLPAHAEALWPLLPEIETISTSVFISIYIFGQCHSICSNISQSVTHSSFLAGPQPLDICIWYSHLIKKEKREKVRPKDEVIEVPLRQQGSSSPGSATMWSSTTHGQPTSAQGCLRRQIFSPGFTNILINIKVQKVKREEWLSAGQLAMFSLGRSCKQTSKQKVNFLGQPVEGK